MEVAFLAKRIVQAETDDKVLIENAFIAGLMHDVGKLLLFSGMYQQYVEAIDLASNQQYEIFKAEQQVFNAEHAIAGGYLIGLWGLPGSVVEAVCFHHRLDHYPCPSFSLAVAVHAADIIAYTLNPDPHFRAPILNISYFEQAGLESRFDFWLETSRETTR